MMVSFVSGLVWPEIKQVMAIYPRNFHFLPGVFTTVFVHKDLEHLSSNSLPLFVCLFGLFYFYKEIALKVTLICHLLTGVLIWIFARSAFHIGASGLVYALVLFVFTSGLIRKNKKLLVFAFLTLVFQSGLLWGVFPLEEGVSWESHLFGAIVGIFLSFLFKNEGPQADKMKEWGEEDDDAINDEYLNL
jgi:membrane associated rhomboid family serine protease